jgi:hypothetical protein
VAAELDQFILRIPTADVASILDGRKWTVVEIWADRDMAACLKAG